MGEPVKALPDDSLVLDSEAVPVDRPAAGGVLVKLRQRVAG